MIAGAAASGFVLLVAGVLYLARRAERDYDRMMNAAATRVVASEQARYL